MSVSEFYEMLPTTSFAINFKATIKLEERVAVIFSEKKTLWMLVLLYTGDMETHTVVWLGLELSRNNRLENICAANHGNPLLTK